MNPTITRIAGQRHDFFIAHNLPHITVTMVLYDHRQRTNVL